MFSRLSPRGESQAVALLIATMLVLTNLAGCRGGYSSFDGYKAERRAEFPGAQWEPGANESFEGKACQWMIWRFPDGSVKQDLACLDGSGGVFIAKTQDLTPPAPSSYAAPAESDEQLTQEEIVALDDGQLTEILGRLEGRYDSLTMDAEFARRDRDEANNRGSWNTGSHALSYNDLNSRLATIWTTILKLRDEQGRRRMKVLEAQRREEAARNARLAKTEPWRRFLGTWSLDSSSVPKDELAQGENWFEIREDNLGQVWAQYKDKGRSGKLLLIQASLSEAYIVQQPASFEGGMIVVLRDKEGNPSAYVPGRYRRVPE